VQFTGSVGQDAVNSNIINALKNVYECASELVMADQHSDVYGV